MNGDAEAAEDSTLPLDDGNIHVCQDGPRDAPHSSSSTIGAAVCLIVPSLTKTRER